MTQEELDAIMNNNHDFANAMEHEWSDPSPIEYANATQQSSSMNPFYDLLDEFHTYEKALNNTVSILHANISLFQTLTLKFPHIDLFKTQLEQNCDAREHLNGLSAFCHNVQERLEHGTQAFVEEEKAHHKLEQVVHLMQGFSSYAEYLLNDQADVNEQNIQTLLSLFGRK